MDKHFAVAKNLTTIQEETAIAGFIGNHQNKTGFAARDIRNLAIPGAVDDTSLKVLLSKAANQGLLELNGANYLAKGHAKTGQSKARSQSKAKKPGKKAPASKGRKKSAGAKKPKAAGAKKSKSAGAKKGKKSKKPKKGEAPRSMYT